MNKPRPKISIKPRSKLNAEPKPSVKAGVRAATKDLNHKYNLECNLDMLLDFRTEARKRKHSPPDLIRRYMERQLNAWDMETLGE